MITAVPVDRGLLSWRGYVMRGDNCYEQESARRRVAPVRASCNTVQYACELL